MLERTVEEVTRGRVFALLPDETQEQIRALSEAEVREGARRALTRPMPGGFLLFDHWTWEGHRSLEWFPWELFCALVPLAREWIRGAGLPLEERLLAGRSPQWWMRLQKPDSVLPE